MRKPDDNFFFILVMIFTVWALTLPSVIEFFTSLLTGTGAGANTPVDGFRGAGSTRSF